MTIHTKREILPLLFVPNFSNGFCSRVRNVCRASQSSSSSSPHPCDSSIVWFNMLHRKNGSIRRKQFYFVFILRERKNRGKLVPLIKNHFAVENECKTFPLCKWMSSTRFTDRIESNRFGFYGIDFVNFFIMLICVAHKNNYRTNSSHNNWMKQIIVDFVHLLKKLISNS